MERKKMIHFTLITTIIGFMLAVQFQTIRQPVVRDTRDIWELRKDLKQEQELQHRLLLEIRDYEEKLHSYEKKQSTSKETVLQETVNELKQEAGLTEAKGAGLVLTIEPFYPDNYVGPITETVSPELLKRLVNELNMYGAKEIAIANERIINTTAIRDVNGVTKVNNRKLTSLPIEVKVIADDVQSLYSHLQVSNILDDFIIENLQLTVSKPMSTVILPPYEGQVRVKYMKAVKAEKEEN
ncbi:uncharacterized protein YlxW (UPF0749 family) [Anoxybacillus caldiproteolyticus]|uniref:Uncharacterized protein YlxW (UPF0749 family) n=1 Tax=Thermaerobacillus caldiproteolyticus TaxID=247480 RepID=A0A7V9Z4W3_9BACL|nr:uncharacterized protein YlxW (UPF0749 family) [Anoxybacillus caldiproteolyticus]